MSNSKKWTDDRIEEAIDILRQNHEYSEALDDLDESSDSLSSAFRRSGLQSPTTYLADNEREAHFRQHNCSNNDVITTVVANDFHVPFHHKKAVDLWLKFCQDIQPDRIIINGDFLDCYSVSQFTKKPGMPSLQDEIDEGLEILEELREKCPLAEMWYTEGNHEKRLRSLIKVQHGLYNLKAFELESLLDFDRLGIKYKNYMEPVRLGNLSVVHGNKVSKHSAYSAKRTVVDQGYENVIVGHTHRIGWYNHTGVNGRKRGFENGGLFDINQAHYIDGIPNWQCGFCVVYQNENNEEDLQITPVEMNNDTGRFYWQGKLYS